MIFLYCRSKHGSVKELCAECGLLERYASQRLERCRFGEDKPTCATCPVHCYKSDMRMKIKEVMRFSGPRMMLYHPVDAICHFYQEIRRARHYAAKNRINNKK